MMKLGMFTPFSCGICKFPRIESELKFHLHFCFPEQKRSKREKQVRKLRDEISEKKTLITTVTKGIPFAKIEVRPQDQLPKHSGPLTGEANPMLSSTAAAALIAHGMSSTTPVPFGGPASTK